MAKIPSPDSSMLLRKEKEQKILKKEFSIFPVWTTSTAEYRSHFEEAYEKEIGKYSGETC